MSLLFRKSTGTEIVVISSFVLILLAEKCDSAVGKGKFFRYLSVYKNGSLFGNKENSQAHFFIISIISVLTYKNYFFKNEGSNDVSKTFF